jgi:endonuclease YncB( thermonuclease family)
VVRPYVYRFRLDRVVDGDSLAGFGFKYEVPVRLSLFDAAEVRRPASDAEIAAGKRVKAFLEELLSGQSLLLHSHKLAVYCRAEGELYIDGEPVSVNEQVIRFIRENGLEKAQFRA